jgi:hypothetical protein
LILIKSWSRGIQEAKQHIYRAMQESREGQDENNPIMRLRQQHATSQSSNNNNNNNTTTAAAAAAENSYGGAYPREKNDGDVEEDLYDDADDGGDSGSFDDDDGVGPWGGMDRQKSDLSADTMSSLTFHEAVNEIKSLTSAPLQPESLKYCVT